MRASTAPHQQQDGSRFQARLAAALIFVVAGVAFLVSRGRNEFRCHQECYGDPPLSRYGSRSYESGHPWTNYAHAWQWSAQHGLTQLAIVAAIVGLGMTLATRRTPLPALLISASALAAWLAWVLYSPPIP